MVSRGSASKRRLWALIGLCVCSTTAYSTTHRRALRQRKAIHGEDAATYSRPLQPPYPNGSCGGKVVSIPAESTFAVDVNLSGNTLLLPPRTIQVWLPPDYDDGSTTRRKHPVLYCHDGQNAMEDASSWTGMSWRLMGAITRMADRGMIGETTPIVVLLPSCSDHLLPGVSRRHLEYGDVSLPFSRAHADFVALTLKPFVDSTFLTNPKQSHAIGTSLGGQASLHLLLRYPNLFQGAACLSPCFQPAILAQAALQASCLKEKRIYLDMGGNVEDTTVPFFDVMDHLTPRAWHNPGYWWLDTQLRPSLDAMRTILKDNGIPHLFQEIPGGRHNERAWAQRIDKPLQHLFGKS